MTTRTGRPGAEVSVPGISALLDGLLWVGPASTMSMHDLRTGRRLVLVKIEGTIKPDLSAESPAALRKGYAESFEKVMALLEGAGVRFSRHPELAVSGRVRDSEDGTQDFEVIKAEVRIELLA